MRKFLPEREANQRNLILVKQLRTNDPLGIYARRSNPTAKNAKKDRSQSREMQTGDMIKWGMNSGWKRDLIHPYFADLGLSGTLRPDQRPDMLRLFDDIDAGKFDNGTIAFWQENRGFRDETHIYYNQLIDKMLQHNIVLVVLSPQLYIYDMRDPFDKERLREKFKESAEFIPKHIKGWLHPARERAAWEDDEWAGMGDPPPGFIVDFNPKSETYKRFIPYWPHIEKVKEHFLLYRELGGENSLLYQHLRVSPIIFPEFGPEVDRINVDRFKLNRYPGGGYYISTTGTIKAMFSHPLYSGYRAVKGVIRRDSQGNKIQSFEPVIDLDLWEFAFYRNASTDLDGNPIEGRNKSRRFFQQDQEGNFGLLKFRIVSSQGGVHTSANGGRSIYCIKEPDKSFLLYYDHHAVMSCDEIDNLVVKRLFEHVERLCQNQENIECYEEHVTRSHKEHLARINQIEQSISDIDKSQSGLTRNLGKVEAEIEEAKQAEDEEKVAIKERRKQLIEDEIETLEIERKRLIHAKEEIEEEGDEEIGTLEEELIKLKNGWPNYRFKKRRSLINFAIQEVVLDVMSTHWVKVEVLWLHQEWGRERLFYYRQEGSKKEWCDEELTIVKEHYATMPKYQIMALLPNRGWEAIRTQGRIYGLSRPRGRTKNGTNEYVSTNESYSDLKFMRQEGIPLNTKYIRWESQQVP